MSNSKNNNDSTGLGASLFYMTNTKYLPVIDEQTYTLRHRISCENIKAQQMC